MKIQMAALLTVCMCLSSNVADGQAGEEPATRGGIVEGKAVVVEGVDRFRVVEPMFECVRVVMSHLGEDYSPAYIQGISGAAFRISGICPCAPTVGVAMHPPDLIRMLGYRLEVLEIGVEGVDPEKRLDEVLDRIKEEVRSGRPALLWHAFTTAEWDVVCGYDEEKKELLGRGSYKGKEKYARADERRPLTSYDICGYGPAIVVGEKIGEYDARAAERAALREAVRHGRSYKNTGYLGGKTWGILEGLACYDRWIDDFRDPERVRQSGDSYDLGIYASTHRAAAGFLREIAPKYPKATQYLEAAAECFAAEADALDSCLEVLGWKSPKGPDSERNAKVVDRLSRAREQYGLAIGEIEEALRAMDERRIGPGNAGSGVYGGAFYRFEWIGPETPRLESWENVPIRSSEPYGAHVNPLYNFQEDVPHESPEGDDWGGLWKQLAEGLASDVELLGLVAYEGDKLAGMVRFLPKKATKSRYGAWGEEAHKRAWANDILWIGAAFVDYQGAADGLDTELVRRVVDYARTAGYSRIQCLGWSDLRPYAMWGQVFPASVFEGKGFKPIATLDGSHLKCLPDMLAGSHGPDVQRAVKEEMEALGLTAEAAETFHILERDCR